jgi:8-oxo-dGTP pyrophosphatase MutT (NUDIX family)
MLPRLAAALLLATALRGCLTYEYEHEVWLQVDGSGVVNVTGRPGLWTAFKGLPLDEGDPDAMKAAARELFERSGLSVRRVTVTKRRGHAYLFVSAAFNDVNRVSFTPAFPDLRIGLRREGGRLYLDGSWQRPIEELARDEADREGLMAVRFHLPSKVYGHRRAADGVERGNILGWRQETAAALDGGRLEFGAEMDGRSILSSTVMLFAGAVVLAVVLLALALWAVVRQGRKDLQRSP